MCNCIEEQENLVLTHLKKRDPTAIIERGGSENGFQNVTMNLTTGKWMAFLDYQYQHTRLKVNGEPGKPTKKHIALHFTYCPFCGQKLPA